MKRWLGCLLAIALWVQAAPAYAGGSPEGAKQFIDTVARQVLDVLKTNDSKQQKQLKLEKIFSSKVNAPFVAKFVLGQNWRTATPQQQREYVAAYGPFVIGNYANKLTRYSGQDYTLKDARPDDDGFIVTMMIIGGNSADAQVDYRLKSGGPGGYQLVDIVVEGVSLLATQRSEFNSIVQSKGMDHLISQLKSSTVTLHNGG